MSKPDLRRPDTPLDWVLVGNASRARCFVRDAENHAMREFQDFVHTESRLKGQALADDRGGLVRKSQAATQFQPHTEPLDKAHEQFARELAAVLEEAALAHRFAGVALIASNPFLGELKRHLGQATRQCLSAAVPLDLTRYSGAELERRVTQALPATAE